MTIKRLRWGRALTAFVFVAAIISGPFMQVQTTHAAGGTATWTGSAGDHKFSTAANWEENAIPETGDVLVFNTESTPQSGNWELLQNDVAASYAGITSTTASPTPLKGYNLSTLQLLDNATWNIQYNLQVDADTTIAGGDLTVIGVSPYNLTMNGVLTLRNTNLGKIPSGITGLVVEKSATVGALSGSAVESITFPVTIGGGTGSLVPTLNFFSAQGGGGGASIHQTFSSITLLGDAEISVMSPHIAEVSSITKNGFSLARTADSSGQLIIVGEEAQTNQEKTTQLDGDSPGLNVTVVDKETAVLNGTRANVNVENGGTLKGNGTVQSLSTYGTAVIAPGNSPGKITVVDNLSITTGTTFVAEILNKDSYDQLVVGGNVGITDATLELQFIAGGVVNQGETFTIIKNDGPNPVIGTFAGLAEGAQITIGAAVFSISYVGGDGNDVVLTALTTGNAPGVGNTGAHLSLTNPVVIAVLGVVAAAAVLLMTRRSSVKK